MLSGGKLSYAGRIVWPYKPNFKKRTDEKFKTKSYRFYQKSESILSTLSIGLVSQVPLDFLHVLCLGVQKRLLKVWVDKKGPYGVKLSNTKIQQLSNYH